MTLCSDHTMLDEAKRTAAVMLACCVLAVGFAAFIALIGGAGFPD